MAVPSYLHENTPKSPPQRRLRSLTYCASLYTHRITKFTMPRVAILTAFLAQKRTWRQEQEEIQHGHSGPTLLEFFYVWRNLIRLQGMSPADRGLSLSVARVGYTRVRLLVAELSLPVSKSGLSFYMPGEAGRGWRGRWEVCAATKKSSPSPFLRQNVWLCMSWGINHGHTCQFSFLFNYTIIRLECALESSFCNELRIQVLEMRPSKYLQAQYRHFVQCTVNLLNVCWGGIAV